MGKGPWKGITGAGRSKGWQFPAFLLAVKSFWCPMQGLRDGTVPIAEWPCSTTSDAQVSFGTQEGSVPCTRTPLEQEDKLLLRSYLPLCKSSQWAGPVVMLKAPGYISSWQPLLRDNYNPSIIKGRWFTLEWPFTLKPKVRFLSILPSLCPKWNQTEPVHA